MRILPFTQPHHVPAAAAAVKEVLAVHGVIALPTETFYGLAVNPWDPQAVAEVFTLKGRAPDKHLLVVAADPQQAEELAVIPEPWRSRLAAIWPAPLTVVFAARRPLPGAATTVAVRVPDLAVLRLLLKEVGPLTATSANFSGKPPATRPEELGLLASRVGLILDGGATPGGMPSTVLDATVSPPRVLRPGCFFVPQPWLEESRGSQNCSPR